MDSTSSPLICARGAMHTDAGPCAVIFEGPDLPALAAQVTEWAATHPQYAVLAFSHARETRMTERVSLAGPQTVPVYTGLLLVHPVPGAADASPERRTRRDLVGSRPG